MGHTFRYTSTPPTTLTPCSQRLVVYNLMSSAMKGFYWCRCIGQGIYKFWNSKGLVLHLNRRRRELDPYLNIDAAMCLISPSLRGTEIPVRHFLLWWTGREKKRVDEWGLRVGGTTLRRVRCNSPVYIHKIGCRSRSHGRLSTVADGLCSPLLASHTRSGSEPHRIDSRVCNVSSSLFRRVKWDRL